MKPDFSSMTKTELRAYVIAAEVEQVESLIRQSFSTIKYKLAHLVRSPIFATHCQKILGGAMLVGSAIALSIRDPRSHFSI